MQLLKVIPGRFVVLLVLVLVPATVRAQVLINEIAWMGTENSANDEWLELLNSGSESVDLTGWTLTAADGRPSINLSLVTPAGGFLLLERTDDTSVPNVPADVIYTGALENSGEILVLKNAAGLVVQKVDGADNWKINGASETVGNNTTKETAQLSNGAWITAAATPRAPNTSIGESETAPAETQQAESAPVSSSAPPTSPQTTSLSLRVAAGPDRTAEVGELLTFDGTGSQGGASYRWYFGDGFGFEDSVVSHRYNSPGRYTVTLEVSDGSRTSTDDLIVEVRPPRVVINEFFVSAAAGESWIELFNPTDTAANVGGWTLEIGTAGFELLSSSRIVSKGFLVLEERTTLLRPGPNRPIRIRSDGGSIVDEVLVGEIKLDWSASRQADKFYWTSQPTPGAANIIITPVNSVSEPIKTAKTAVPSKELASPENNNIVAAAVAEKPEIDRKQIDTIAWLSIVVGFSVAVGLGTTWYLRKHKQKNFIS